jgi:hypothetical protein
MRERILDAAAAIALFTILVLPFAVLAWLISVIV